MVLSPSFSERSFAHPSTRRKLVLEKWSAFHSTIVLLQHFVACWVS